MSKRNLFRHLGTWVNGVKINSEEPAISDGVHIFRTRICEEEGKWIKGPHICANSREHATELLGKLRFELEPEVCAS